MSGIITRITFALNIEWLQAKGHQRTTQFPQSIAVRKVALDVSSLDLFLLSILHVGFPSSFRLASGWKLGRREAHSHHAYPYPFGRILTQTHHTKYVPSHAMNAHTYFVLSDTNNAGLVRPQWVTPLWLLTSSSSHYLKTYTLLSTVQSLAHALPWRGGHSHQIAPESSATAIARHQSPSSITSPATETLRLEVQSSISAPLILLAGPSAFPVEHKLQGTCSEAIDTTVVLRPQDGTDSENQDVVSSVVGLLVLGLASLAEPAGHNLVQRA
ncbi:hypothetical protein B0T10DRAFT_476020, partial [Thelonectria olida]